MKDRPFLIGSFLVGAGILGFVGSITGTLAAMLAALFDRSDLVAIRGSSLAFPGIVDFLVGGGAVSGGSASSLSPGTTPAAIGGGNTPDTLPSGSPGSSPVELPSGSLPELPAPTISELPLPI